MRHDTRTGARGRGGCKRSEHARSLAPARGVAPAAPLPLGSPLRSGRRAGLGLALCSIQPSPWRTSRGGLSGPNEGLSRPERSGERSGAFTSPRAGTFAPCRRGVTRTASAQLVPPAALVLPQTNGKAPGSLPVAFPVHSVIGLRDLESVQCPG